MDGLGRGKEAALLWQVDVAPVTGLPLEVLGDPGLQQDLHKVSRAHDELGDKVDVPVAIRAEGLRRLCAWAELLPQVGDVQRCALASVVVIAIKVKDLLARDGQQAAQNALL